MTRDENHGIDALYGDVVESDLPAPELLARYVADPGSLSPEERREIETARTRSAIVADELATLRNMDMSVFREEAGEARRQGATVIPFRRRVLRAVTAPRVALALAASLAGLVWWVGVRPDAEEPQRVAEETLPAPATPGEVPELETQRPDGLLVAEQRVVEDEAREPAPPVPSLVPEPPAPLPPPVPAPEKAPVLLAMAMPSYAAPSGQPGWDPGTSVYRAPTPGGGITALVPAHVARATSSRPALPWHLARVPATGRFHLTILDEEKEEEIVLDRALAPPTGPGLQRVDLAELGVALPPGRALRWSVAHRVGPDEPPTEFTFGWIEVAAAGADTGACRSDTPLPERPAACAAAGFWYDALDATVELRRRHPEAEAPREALRRLLGQTELTGIEPL